MGLFASLRQRLPVVLQSEAAECGLACLAMIASYHGHSLDINETRHRFRISMKGTTLKNLVQFAGSLNLSARALRLEPQQLGNLQCPAILHFDMNHFVVLKGMRGANPIIHDPAVGIRQVGAAECDRRFTGIALELTPRADFERKAPSHKLRLSTLTGGIPTQGNAIGKALILSLLFQLLVLAAPLYVQLVIDRGVSQGDTDALLSLAAGFSFLVLLRGAFAWIRARVLLAFGGYFSARLMGNVVRHMIRLPNSWFESRHVSALLSRVMSTQPVKDLVTDGLVGAVVDGLMAIVTIAAAFLFAPVLALVVLGGFAANALLKFWQVRRSLPGEQDYIEAFARSQQEFIETARGIAAIKLFRKEAQREARWADRHIESVNARYRVDEVRAKADLGRDVIQSLVLVLVVYLGARQVIAASTSLGVLMAFITYQQMFADSSSKLLDFSARYRLLEVQLQRIGDVVLSEPEVIDLAIPGEFAKPLAGALSAKDLHFRYGELEELVLAGVTLDIAPGEFVAITGPSGGGKTTLLKLLIGLLQPTSGTVYYDGFPLRTIGVGNVRDQIGVVMQDDVLLSGSIAQNITFFDAQPDLDWMMECARMAAIDEDIASFHMGYNTLVGDMGSVLSGGQKQRVLLARALYRRPQFLFLDEGTSNLDVAKEKQVNANLQALKMTRVVIAHRRDTIEAADRILELTGCSLSDRPATPRAP